MTVNLSSTAYLQRIATDELAINLVEGSAQITSAGVSRLVPAGARVRIPVDSDLTANGAPSEIEPYDLEEMENLPIALLDREIEIAPPIFDEEGLSRPDIVETSVDLVGVGDAFIVNLDVSASAESCPVQDIPPLDVVLVMDVSGSMSGRPLAAGKGAAINFVNLLDPESDRVSVVQFDDQASTVHPMNSDFESAIGVIQSLG